MLNRYIIAIKRRYYRKKKRNFIGSKEQKVGEKRIRLREILPALSVSEQNGLSHVKSDRVKVRFALSVYITWNSIKTICEQFNGDKKFEVLILVSPLDVNEEFISLLERAGFKWVYSSSYDVRFDQPDIFIFNNPFTQLVENYSFNQLRKNCKLIIIASMQITQYGEGKFCFWDQYRLQFSRFSPDYVLLDRMLYKQLKRCPMPWKMVEMGNAKYDSIYYCCKAPNKGKWEKLNNKKIFLWATTHGIYGGRISKVVTFDVYANAIFEYLEQHKNVGLIFRPHPTLMRELVWDGYWTAAEMNAFKLYCETSDNIIYDDSDGYEDAVSVADGIIADAYCGIPYASLPTMKPILLLFRAQADKDINPEVSQSLYRAYEPKDVNTFMDNVLKGIDAMKESRRKASEDYVYAFDGMNGRRIKEFIEKAFDAIDKK